MIAKSTLPQFTCGLQASTFETAQGITNYYDLGSSTNKPIVLVSGYLCSALMFKDLAEHLVKNSFRVIMYDLYGTGGSIKTSKGNYTLETMVGQLHSLISNLYLRDVIIIGYSMGGLIAATYAKSNKHKVKKCIFISPAGVHADLGPPSILRIMRTPFIGPYYMKLFYNTMIMPAVKINFVHPEDPEFAEVIQFLHMHIYTSWCMNPSFCEAACNMMRYMTFTGMQDTMKNIGVPVTVILAKKDICVTYKENFEFWSGISSVKLHILDECGHWALHEKREEMFDIIDKSLKE